MRRMLSLLILMLAGMGILLAGEPGKVIDISTQEQFASLDEQVKKYLKQGVTTIDVVLQSGIYYYGEKHLDLSSVAYPEATVTITGHDAMLVAKDLGAARTWQDGTFDAKSRSDVNRWSTLEQSPSMVEVIDKDEKICRIRTPRKQKKKSGVQCEGEYLQLTEWYDSKIYPVMRHDKKYIYFLAPDLKYSQSFGDWNVNYDLAYGHVTPRYRTMTQHCASETVTFCQASTFVNLWHSQLKQFALHGIAFGPNNGKAPLIDTDMFETSSLLIEDCTFSGVRGLVLKVWHTDNVTVRSNTFDGCYADGIESHNMCRNTQVTGNHFRNHGEGMRQNFAVICRGEDFLIKDNTFRNFSYSAIGVGVWYGNQKKGPVTGMVAGNDIAFEQDYYNNYSRHTLMDGGAIYTWTIQDKVDIILNTIDRYRGMRDYRGIFCDDGAKNLTIRNNTVKNIGEDCWCIDLRWVDNVSDKVPDHNTGNVVTDNNVDGRVRFE